MEPLQIDPENVVAACHVCKHPITGSGCACPTIYGDPTDSVRIQKFIPTPVVVTQPSYGPPSPPFLWMLLPSAIPLSARAL